jgi:hypothetical protein
MARWGPEDDQRGILAIAPPSARATREMADRGMDDLLELGR